MKKYLCVMMIVMMDVFMAVASTGAEIAQQESIVHIERVENKARLVTKQGHVLRLVGVRVPEYDLSQIKALNPSLSESDHIELSQMGKKTNTFLTDLIKGHKVRIQYQAPYRDENDHWLVHAYAFDTHLNTAIIAAGYGIVEPLYISDDQKQQWFALQSEARKNQRGWWKAGW